MYIHTQDILNKNQLTYQEILNVKKRLNGWTKNKDLTLDEVDMKEEYLITDAQTQKGLDWLYNIAFKPTHLKKVLENQDWIDQDTRSNCPLGYRELVILINFNHFTFNGFYHNCTSYMEQDGHHNLLPIWKCYDNDGDSFEYYVEGGEIRIIG